MCPVAPVDEPWETPAGFPWRQGAVYKFIFKLWAEYPAPPRLREDDLAFPGEADGVTGPSRRTRRVDFRDRRSRKSCARWRRVDEPWKLRPPSPGDKAPHINLFLNCGQNTRRRRDFGKTTWRFPARRTAQPGRVAGRAELTSGTGGPVSHVPGGAGRRALETPAAFPWRQGAGYSAPKVGDHHEPNITGRRRRSRQKKTNEQCRVVRSWLFARFGGGKRSRSPGASG